MNLTPRSRNAWPPLGRAGLLAALALAVSPSSAAAQDPAAIVEAAIPHDSVISEQYQRVQEVLDQAAAVVPDTPLAQPAAESAPPPAAEPPDPPPPPESAPKPDQYHSETPTNVSVTQEQPSNVNVSIRINSPGDDGPVVQINNAGGSTEVEQVVQRPLSTPEPAAPPAGGDLPDTWEWVWTSACFGGAPRAGAAAAVPGWSWRWSCDEQGDGGENLVSGLGVVPDGVVPDVDELIAAATPTFAAAPLTTAAVPERPRARPDRRRDGVRRSSAAVGGAGQPPAAGGGAPRAGPPLASAHAPPAAAVRPHRDARAEARARPGDGSASNNLPPSGDGPALGASTALGGVAALLLGIWTAVLLTAVVIVVPRLRHRRWSGPIWRLPRLLSARLERPG